jgi:hypothetical protein
MVVLCAPENYRSVRLISPENLEQCRTDSAFDSCQLDHVVHWPDTLAGLCPPNDSCANMGGCTETHAARQRLITAGDGTPGALVY